MHISCSSVHWPLLDCDLGSEGILRENKEAEYFARRAWKRHMPPTPERNPPSPPKPEALNLDPILRNRTVAGDRLLHLSENAAQWLCPAPARFEKVTICLLSLRYQTIAKPSLPEGEVSLQVQQNSQPVLDLGHGGWGDGAPARDQPVLADGAHRFAQEGGGICQAAFRWLDDNMEWDGSQSGCDGDDDDEVGAALVEWVHGNDQHRSASGLLVAAHRVQISEPNLASGGGGGHRSGSEGLQPIVGGGVERGDFPVVAGICREAGVGRSGLLQKPLAAIRIQSRIKDIRHRGMSILRELGEDFLSSIGNTNGGWHTAIY